MSDGARCANARYWTDRVLRTPVFALDAAAHALASMEFE